MANTDENFLVEDDNILAFVLEESLRDYNEIQKTLDHHTNKHAAPTLSNIAHKISTINTNKPNSVCHSPKKCSTVQSRLSNFFSKSKTNQDNEVTNTILLKQTDKSCVELNSPSKNDDVYISSSHAIFYKEPDAEGFHLFSGTHYVYPSNMPVREYQMNIIKTCLFNNTLVSLPTGLGKTFIAAVVMYNFYRWYPLSKIIFMAPTRPLVNQQIQACHLIMGIPKESTFEMTGNISPEQRYIAWKKYRVFFLTPQVLANDLKQNKCPSELIKCIIIDEAHRATKDYAYVQVLKYLQDKNQRIRIVGLSATPGTTIESVIEVIQNLSISKLEFRTDDSPDVIKYTNQKEVTCVSVKLSDDILNIRSQFLVIYDKYSRRLKQYRLINGNVTNLTKFQLLGSKQKFMSHMAREMPKHLVGSIINDFNICMSLAYALELLIIYGVKVFYLQSLEMLENNKSLSLDVDLKKILDYSSKQIHSQDLTWSHPKLLELKQIVKNYFGEENTGKSSKIIIFCQYRLVVVEIYELLKTFGSDIKPVMFVGQSLKDKGGLPQKKQLEVMKKFKNGDYNVLIATSVAEEGLDIGEVDLIICLEANKSPIKFIQRLGRTGRKRSGKCITLLTEGKEETKFKSSVASSKTLVHKMLKNPIILSKLATDGPRLVPQHIKPELLMIYVKNQECSPKKEIPKENIMPFIESNNNDNSNDDRIDIFQNIKDKPKVRSKRQKASKFEINDQFKNEICNIENNFINNDFNFHNTNSPIVITSNENAEECNFEIEEKAFNEWKKLSKSNNSSLFNNEFFELLDLFTDSCSDVNDSYFNNAHLKCNDADSVILLNSTTKRFHIDLENNSKLCNTSPKIKTIELNECFSKVDYNEPLKSQKAIGYIEDYMNKIEDHKNNDIYDNNLINISECDESNDELEHINIEQLFRSQRANEYIEEYNNKIATDQNIDSNKLFKGQVSNTSREKCHIFIDNQSCSQQLSLQLSKENDPIDCKVKYYMKPDEEKYIKNISLNSNDRKNNTDKTDYDDDDDNDKVILITDSPEFLSRKIPKKIVQQKLTDYNSASTTETIDLLTPPYLPNCNDQSMEKYKLLISSSTTNKNDIAITNDTNSIHCFNVHDVFSKCITPTLNNKKNPSLTTKKLDDSSSIDVFTEKKCVPDGTIDISTQIKCAKNLNINTRKNEIKKNESEGTKTQKPQLSSINAKLSINGNSLNVVAPHTYNTGLLSSNILKACNLLKPGFSLKRNIVGSKQQRFDEKTTAEEIKKPSINVSPILTQDKRQQSKFSQSTPKFSISTHTKRIQTSIPAPTESVNFLTSSSGESDVFLDNFDSHLHSNTTRRRRRPKKILPKRKKLIFIDDEADVSHCYNETTMNTSKSSSDDESENDDNNDFDSSFIDDEKAEPSTSMTKHYLQSVKSPINARGVFKIPKLSNQHYNIDVYSQMIDDRIENSYQEDSFCVEDASDLNISSSQSIQQMSEKRPSKPPKRKRILSPQSSDSDSSSQLNKTMVRKRAKVKISLNFNK